VSVSFSFIKKPLIMDGFRFCFLYFSFLHLVGNTVLVVSPGFILLIKSVGLLFLCCLLNVLLQLHQLIGQIGNSSFMSVLILAREAWLKSH
jgi:hypothetical protein